MARTPPGPIKDASTCRLPPQRAQANTPSVNLLRSSRAQSNCGILSFFGSSTIAAKDGLSSSGSGSSPFEGTILLLE
jgi:hypothetical protein